MTDDDYPEHYHDLQEVRMELIDEHQRLKAYVNADDDPQNVGTKYAEGKRDGTIQAISQIEDLLNEWADDASDDSE